jgi:teichoic acid transport system permease protein
VDIADVAAAHGLHRIGGRPPLGEYLKSTWSRRDFIFTMASFRMRASLETNRLGVFWLLLNPVLDALFYGVLFALLIGRERPGGYGAYVIIGVFLFHFFSKCLTQGSRSITSHRALVQSLAFPRISLPLAEVCQQFLSLLPCLGLMVVLLPFMGHWPDWDWLLFIPLMVLYVMFNTGVTLIAARLTVHIRDLTQVLPFISRILFFASGTLFDVSQIFEKYPWVITIYDFYPLYQVLTLARGMFMGEAVAPFYWISLTIWAVAVFVGGLLFFWVAEERYGRD